MPSRSKAGSVGKFSHCCARAATAATTPQTGLFCALAVFLHCSISFSLPCRAAFQRARSHTQHTGAAVIPLPHPAGLSSARMCRAR